MGFMIAALFMTKALLALRKRSLLLGRGFYTQSARSVWFLAFKVSKLRGSVWGELVSQVLGFFGGNAWQSGLL